MTVVAAGGLVGSVGRAGVGLLVAGSGEGFPFSILIVNLLGSLLLGVYLARRERSVVTHQSLRFWAIGVLGSFTTFSTFSVDLVRLLDGGHVLTAAIYLMASLLGGLGLAFLGLRIGGLSR